jgi:hypothetical protein
MAITTADGYFAAATQQIIWRKTAAITTVATAANSLLDVAGLPGAGSFAIGNTTTGIVPTDLTAGAPLINAFGGGATGYLAAGSFRNTAASGVSVYDRLWHAGSVSMTSLVTTTFASQPSYTSRLPGGADYGNLDIFIEFAAAVSATATTISVNYTNEAGVTGRTTGPTVSLASQPVRRLFAMPLQAGDKGVQKIESVTVGGVVATTGTFNVIVARKLAEFDIRVANGADIQSWDVTGSPEIYADSCIWPVVYTDGTSSGLPYLSLTIKNG